jgi:hypothetical protein
MSNGIGISRQSRALAMPLARIDARIVLHEPPLSNWGAAEASRRRKSIWDSSSMCNLPRGLVGEKAGLRYERRHVACKWAMQPIAGRHGSCVSVWNMALSI